MSPSTTDQTGNKGFPEWLEHAWNQATTDWFLALNEEEQYAIWDAFSFLPPSSFFDGSIDPLTLPGEDFITSALVAMTGGDKDSGGKPEFTPEGGDLFTEALAYAYRMDISHVMFMNPGWLVGIRFSRERAEHLLSTYLAPVLKRSGRTIASRDSFRYAMLTHPDVPADLALPYLKAILSPDHADGDKYYFLTIWRRYLGFARDSDHLAELANLAEDAILLGGGARNKAGDYFVGVLRHLTQHPDFPESWVERHMAMGYADFPLLYPPHGEEGRVAYEQKYANSRARSQVIQDKVPSSFSNPYSITNETALATGAKVVNGTVQEITIDLLQPHTVGWYFESLSRTREAMGAGDNIPDEWLKELL